MPVKSVELHDGLIIVLKKREQYYDLTNHWQVLRMLEEAHKKLLVDNGLIYVNIKAPTLYHLYDLPDVPLNRLSNKRLRPNRESIKYINDMLS